MDDVPTDIGEPQEIFQDAIRDIFDDPDGNYEVLDTNLSDDPFEPDITVMDADEWVFTVLCYYIEEVPSHGVLEIFPKTFGMRKWVEDSTERPAFLALGVGGTPTNPEVLYFSRFYNFPDRIFEMERNKDLMINWMRPEFFDKVIRDEFDRIYSPS